MKKTGELLKQKRESANLSLSEVALATKINPKILTAIECGDESHLPAKTFLKGFVRSYAVFLKMDVDEVMHQFTEDTGGQVTPPVHEAYRQTETPNGQTARRRPPEEGSSAMRTVAVVVIALLIGLIIGVRELIEKYQKEKVVSTEEVKVSPLMTPPVVPQPSEPKSAEAKSAEAKSAEVTTAESKPSESKSTESKPVEPKLAEPKPADEKVVKDGKDPKPEETMAAKPTEIKPTVGIPRGLLAPKEIPVVVQPKVEEPPKPAPEPPAAQPAPKAEVASKADAATSTGAPESALQNLKNEIILEALDKVDVEFKVHGKSQRFSLGPTQVHTIRTDGPLVLDLSDGGAVNIILNGHERGVPGDLGKPKQVKIP